MWLKFAKTTFAQDFSKFIDQGFDPAVIEWADKSKSRKRVDLYQTLKGKDPQTSVKDLRPIVRPKGKMIDMPKVGRLFEMQSYLSTAQFDPTFETWLMRNLESIFISNQNLVDKTKEFEILYEFYKNGGELGPNYFDTLNNAIADSHEEPAIPQYKRPNRFKFIDLFSGIGGIRTPFDDLGGQCVLSSEIDKFASETYRENYGEKPSGDITQIPPEELPDFDVLLGGFPCQPFSSAGLQQGFEDEKGRGNLFFNIVDIISKKRPKAFLLENVRGLVSHNQGNTFKIVLDYLENKLGYDIHIKMINSIDYVPQNRDRIYIVGFRDQVDFKFPAPPEKRLYELRDILEKEVEDKYTLSDKEWQSILEHKEKQKALGRGFGYRLFNPESGHIGTLTKSSGSNLLIEQLGKNPRRLTPREMLRLQGFKDSFVANSSDTQVRNQAGNSVTIPVIRAIANEMIKFI